ncbi:hypothetical protein SQS_03239 [Enterococcus faecalis EnGen0225]|uniref:hypothetical protein n=1 Tax=Enterococcus faecalis TaxID=1351 RepID=UPI00032FCD68|nr:hypothetical protein [Enterococcus faecalis]EOH32493.1 hypothetical protein SQS_03239 [Enterococcus faecalis EnGen0225]PTN72512.1 hypothetical protein DAI16_16945 [Enterococcus faecalis]
MGMYTSLRGAVKVKQEYIKLVQSIVDNGWTNDTAQYPFVNEYLRTERSDFIPCGNELQYPFQKEQEFFNKKYENGIFYFSADLKNYTDEVTNTQPIDSFIKNIIENICKEILLLETVYEGHSTVYQYGFSNEVINEIKVLNYTNKEIESFLYLDIDDEKDIFKEYKSNNNLMVFE